MSISKSTEMEDDGKSAAHTRPEQLVEDLQADLHRALCIVEAQKLELETALKERDQIRSQLETEQHDSQLLHNISEMLDDESNIDVLYQNLVDAATKIMHSDLGCLQSYDSERNALQLIAHRGLDDEAVAFWQWVYPGQMTTCGQALEKLQRVIVPDFETCTFIVGSPDGEAFHKAGVRSAQSTPLLTRNGRLVGMITTHCKYCCEPNERDLRLLDIVARQAADLIERKMATESLKRQAADLFEADRYKNEFLATLAHELRNPLAPIRNGISILKIGKAEHTPPVLAMMERQVVHMTKLIDDLLDVSRISRGAISLSPARVTLSTLIDSAVEASCHLFDSANQKFTVKRPGNIVWLHVDVMRVVQIISNLLNNAAKYTPQGGQIELVAEVIETQVVIRIIDTGIGIPAAMLSKIFDLFTQVDDVAERSKGGLGVGLALSRKLAEMHEGCIEVDSPGVQRGAVFTLRLPVATSPVAASTTNIELQGDHAYAQPVRILIVDDNADSAQSLSMVLDDLGHLTRVVLDSRGALAAALDFKPDVAILDIGMPYLSGLDLARKFRETPNLKHICITALSGWGTENDMKKSSNAGMDYHLTKPVDINNVVDLLSKVAQRRDSEKLPSNPSISYTL
jgi:signal transduction histidine kinase/ActR/RegA family two-component response regulator